MSSAWTDYGFPDPQGMPLRTPLLGLVRAYDERYRWWIYLQTGHDPSTLLESALGARLDELALDQATLLQALVQGIQQSLLGFPSLSPLAASIMPSRYWGLEHSSMTRAAQRAAVLARLTELLGEEYLCLYRADTTEPVADVTLRPAGCWTLVRQTYKMLSLITRSYASVAVGIRGGTTPEATYSTYSDAYAAAIAASLIQADSTNPYHTLGHSIYLYKRGTSYAADIYQIASLAVAYPPAGLAAGAAALDLRAPAAAGSFAALGAAITPGVDQTLTADAGGSFLSNWTLPGYPAAYAAGQQGWTADSAGSVDLSSLLTFTPLE